MQVREGNHDQVVGGVGSDGDAEAAIDVDSGEIDSHGSAEAECRRIEGFRAEVVVCGEENRGDADDDGDRGLDFHFENVDEQDVQGGDGDQTEEEFLIDSGADGEIGFGLPGELVEAVPSAARRMEANAAGPPTWRERAMPMTKMGIAQRIDSPNMPAYNLGSKNQGSFRARCQNMRMATTARSGRMLPAAPKRAKNFNMRTKAMTCGLEP